MTNIPSSRRWYLQRKKVMRIVKDLADSGCWGISVGPSFFFFWGGGGKKVKKTHRGLLDGDQGLLRCFPILFLVKVLEHHFFWGRNQWYVFFLRCLYKGRHLWQALIWGFGEHPGMGALRIIECLRNKDGKAFMKSTGFKFSTLIFLFGWWLLSYFQYVSNAVCWARDD